MHIRTILYNLVFFLFATLPVFAQQGQYADTVKSVLSSCRSADDSVRVLCSFAWQISQSNKEETYKYGLMALAISRSVNDSLLVSDAYDAAALGYNVTGQKQLAKEYYKTSLEIGMRNDLPSRIAWSGNNLLTIANQEGNLKDAKIYADISIKYFTIANMPDRVLNTLRMMVKTNHNDYIEPLINTLISGLPGIKDEGNKIFSYLEISLLYNKIEDRKKAMSYVQLAMDLADKNQNFKGVIKAYIEISNYFSETQHNYPMSLKYLEKILEINKRENIIDVGSLYLLIGDQHRMMGNDSLALGYFEKALDFGKQKNHRHSKASAYMKLGDIYYQEKRYVDAKDFYLKCYETGCDVCPQITFHDALINIGNVYLLSNDFENARSYFQMGMDLANSASDDRARTKTFQAFSGLSEKRGNIKEAIDYSLKAFGLAQQGDFLEGQRFNASKLSGLYQKYNNYPEALRYLKTAEKLADTISQISEADNLAKLETYFDFQNLQMQNKLDQAEAGKEITKQKLLRNFFIIGFILLGISGFLILLGYKRKRKDNILLREQKKAIEEMSKKVHDADQAKLEFFTNVSHEFKTPLTLILGITEKLKPIVHENQYIEGIRKNSFKLLQLINHLLDLRKIDAHKMRLRVREGNIKELIKGIIGSFQEVAFQKDIKIDFLSTDEEIVGYFDQDKLEKIVSNLLSNSLKYNRESGWVKVSLVKKNDGYIEIDITDNGIGIPEDEMKNIFDRFYRVAERNGHGSGIGLALVKEFVELHKGEIVVKSAINAGTSFIVKIPCDRSFYSENEITFDKNEMAEWEYIEVSDSVKPEAKKEVLIESNPDRKTILIVEDNYDLRKFICDLFKDDFFVLEAPDGLEGYNIAQESVPDIIISDIMMPKLSGIQLVEKIKSEVTTNHIPVILLTAKNDIGTQLSSFEKGTDDYINKPFDSAILKSRVENLLRLRKQLVEKFSKQFQLQPREIYIDDADQKFLQKTIDLIEKYISNPELNVDFLAMELDISRTQLYRKLKALTDYSANQFVRVIRLKRAAQILRQGQNNIAEVMDATGFSNYSYFNNCFKEYFGEFPKEYALLSLKGSAN
jgi:signal transduction histidine kinase/DNA-binding response OmpR family regulator